MHVRIMGKYKLFITCCYTLDVAQSMWVFQEFLTALNVREGDELRYTVRYRPTSPATLRVLVVVFASDLAHGLRIRGFRPNKTKPFVMVRKTNMYVTNNCLPYHTLWRTHEASQYFCFQLSYFLSSFT